MNKTSSRVELSWNIAASKVLSEEQRGRLFARLGSRIFDGSLVVQASEQRSQLRNREIALDKLGEAVAGALAVDPPKRRPTKPTRGSARRHLAAKTQRSATKKLRQRPRED